MLHWSKILRPDLEPVSSNVNEVIRAVLNSLFFLRKYFARTKAPKAPKAPKAQRRNQAKAQNANKRTKIKNVL